MNIEWLFGGDRAEGERKRQGSTATRLFPAAPGNSGNKNFRDSPCTEKSFLVNILHATFRPNRRRGRETAGKTENRRIADWYRPSSATIFIILLTISGCVIWCGTSLWQAGGGVVRAARGEEDDGEGAGDLVEYVAELWRCRGRSAAMPGAGCASTWP